MKQSDPTAGACVCSLPPNEPDIRTKVAFLSEATSYPQQPSSVDVIETHFAWVFLAGERAYKLKKPTQLRGADWRTVAAREQACRAEVRLNSRLSAPTYLGVAPLTQSVHGLQIGGHGPAVDWLVVMRRLERRRMLDSVLAAGTLRSADLDSVLETLIGFYKSQEPHVLAPSLYLQRCTARVEESITVLTRADVALSPECIIPLVAKLRAALAAVQGELSVRASSGHVVQAHGDLRAEHVWLGPPVQIIDALEVYDDLRLLDTAEEIAMLAVECESLGATSEAAYLRECYRRLAQDPVSDALFDFYMAVRAANRAKVAIWHLDDPSQFPDPARWRTRALADGAIAERHCSQILAVRPV